MLPQIKYNIHDAVIISATMPKEDRFEIIVELYKLFYPDAPQIKVIFSGIHNTTKVKSLCEKLNSEVENDWIGCRIDGLEYSSESTKENLYINLKTDWYDALKIHCKKINFMEM